MKNKQLYGMQKICGEELPSILLIDRLQKTFNVALLLYTGYLLISCKYCIKLRIYYVTYQSL